MGSTFRYDVFELAISSALRLPEPTESPGSIPPDVEIKFGTIQAPEDAPDDYSGTEGAILRAPQVGHYFYSVAW